MKVNEKMSIKANMICLDNDRIEMIRQSRGERSFPEMAANLGLSLSTLNSYIYGKVKRIDVDLYAKITGRVLESDVVDSSKFSLLCRLWLFLNPELKVEDLRFELGVLDEHLYGKIKTIDRSLENLIIDKFLEEGFDRDELNEIGYEDFCEERFDVGIVERELLYLQNECGVSPKNFLWNRTIGGFKKQGLSLSQSQINMIKSTYRKFMSGSHGENILNSLLPLFSQKMYNDSYDYRKLEFIINSKLRDEVLDDYDYDFLKIMKDCPGIYNLADVCYLVYESLLERRNSLDLIYGAELVNEYYVVNDAVDLCLEDEEYGFAEDLFVLAWMGNNVHLKYVLWQNVEESVRRNLGYSVSRDNLEFLDERGKGHIIDYLFRFGFRDRNSYKSLKAYVKGVLKN